MAKLMLGILSGLRSKVLVYLAASGLLILAAPPAQACTLFAASGQSVRGGGVIIAKNRDRTPLRSGLRVFAPQEGYRHLGLVSLDSPNAHAVAGINEKGLVVVDASASVLPRPKKNRSAVPLTQALLSRCASVDEVLAQKELLRASYPVFKMVADRNKIAIIEVAPGGLVSAQVKTQGSLGHTNHYLSPHLLWANQKARLSSKVRLARINQLLDRPGAPFTFADFLVFSQDRNAGPDNSINRLGSTPEKTRTLATFVVHISDDAPHVFVRTSNPGEPDRIVNFRLEPGLWVKGLQRKLEAMTQAMPGLEFSD